MMLLVGYLGLVVACVSTIFDMNTSDICFLWGCSLALLISLILGYLGWAIVVTTFLWFNKHLEKFEAQQHFAKFQTLCIGHMLILSYLGAYKLGLTYVYIKSLVSAHNTTLVMASPMILGAESLGMCLTCTAICIKEIYLELALDRSPNSQV